MMIKFILYTLFYSYLWVFIANGIVITNPCCEDVILHTPANFGPRRPDEGIGGHIVNSIPSDGCALSEISYNGSIALVSRGKCTFAMKVFLAQERGAKAVLVMNQYDESMEDNNNMLVTMAASGKDDFLSNINISSFFVSYNSGAMLNNTSIMSSLVITINSTGEVTSHQHPLDFVTIFWSIMMFFFQVFALLWTIVIGTFGISYGYVKYKAKYRSRLIGRLPTRNFSLVDYSAFHSSNCVICIEDFTVNDILRTLPCNHEFHVDCIDPWLITKSNQCPICKQAVIRRRGNDIDSSSRHTSGDSISRINIEAGETPFTGLLDDVNESNGAHLSYFNEGFFQFIAFSTVRVLRFTVTLFGLALMNFLIFYILSLLGSMIRN